KYKFFDDLYNLSINGYKSMGEYLKNLLNLDLSNESSHLVWSQIVSSLDNLLHIAKQNDAKLYEKLMEVVKDRYNYMRPLVDKLGFEPTVGESSNDSELRLLVLGACCDVDEKLADTL